MLASFWLRPLLRWSLGIVGAAAIVLTWSIWTTSSDGANRRLFERKRGSHVMNIYAKIYQESTSISQLVFSPDAKRIAYISWYPRRLVVVDVHSGAAEVIPGTDLPGMEYLAWSPNGALLAFGHASHVSIVSADDFSHAISIKPESDRFFTGMTFSHDSKKIIFSHGLRIGQDVMVSQFELKSQTFSVSVSNPHPGRIGGAGFARFSEGGDSVFYTTIMTDYSRKSSANSIYFVSTCHVFGIDPNGEGRNIYAIDLDSYEGGRSSADVRKIVDCFYSPPADAVVAQRAAEAIGDNGRHRRKPSDRVFDVLDLDFIRRTEKSEVAVSDEEVGIIELIPARALLVSISKRIAIWSLLSGDRIYSFISAGGEASAVAVSNDGRKLAVADRAGTIVVYSVDD